MNFIIRLKGLLLGFTPVRCRVCGKLTEPSIVEGNICSMECFDKEKFITGFKYHPGLSSAKQTKLYSLSRTKPIKKEV